MSARIIGACLSALMILSFQVRADTTDCPTVRGTVALAQCVAAVLGEEEKRLDQAFQKALENLPDRPLSDVRDSRNTTEALRKHLVQGQSAWRTYAEESCAYLGAMQGRGLWIGIFANQCLIREMRSRIEALGRLPGPS
jgi:uncharacterized protein YecT (DUF1311 family)